MIRRTALPSLCLTALALGCSSGTSVSLVTDSAGETAADTAAADAAPEVAVDLPPAEIAPPDVFAETLDWVSDVQGIDSVVADEFGKPCLDNADCVSGFCVMHLGSRICSRPCVEECPGGFACLQFGPTPDPVFACLSLFPTLCLPCLAASDCTVAGGNPASCALLGPEGAFCAAHCSQDVSCPQGYTCADVSTVEGAVVQGCMLADGTCPCTDMAVAGQLYTTCYVENELGKCSGPRYCSETGLGDCQAAVPGAETCDGSDQDCDGDVDEDTCDDGNPCTEDSCSGQEGCINQPLDSVACPDTDPCTAAEVCIQGQCQWTPVTCDDDNVCTVDACNATGGCTFQPAPGDCDDQDPCTVGDTCKQGECSGTLVPCDCQEDDDCDALEDGNACNGTLACVTNGPLFQCQVDPDTVVACPPVEGNDKPCKQSVCVPATGTCVEQPVNDGGPCDDGDPCSIGDSCVAGSCTAGVEPNCNDGDPCTDDFCKPGAGCAHLPNVADCDDGDSCTVADTCSMGACAGVPLSCDDGNPCTDDTCVPGKGCTHPVNAAACDDGDPCTEGDVCSGGSCKGTVAKSCDDGNVCTNEICVPLSGCSYSVNTNPCDDGNPCTVGDACAKGACAPGKPLLCEDGNPCTDDSCNPAAGCVFAANTQQCDDGNSCTTQDKCIAGKCQGTGSLDCDDDNACTKDICLPGGGCKHEALAGSCSDGNPCTVGDSCVNGACTAGPPASCGDANPCTKDACNPKTGLCEQVPEAGPCDDGNPCTVTDACANGKCVGTGSPDCNDEDVCTTDYCDPAKGCVYVVNTAPCDDGNICTTSDKCANGTCVGSGSLACADGNPCTDDACNPVSGCTFAANTAACDDGSKCTEADTCAAGWCVGKTVQCDDGNPCTGDACNPASGCFHTMLSTPCSDGSVCTVDDACDNGACKPGPQLDCDDANDCTADACGAKTGCTHTPVDGTCSDHDECTVGDVCYFGQCVPGPAPNCNDGNLCTNDSCNPAIGCVNVANTVACNDNNACTVGDTCGQSKCQPGPNPLDCNDNDACTTDSCDPTVGCLHQSICGVKYSWSFQAGPTTGPACAEWNAFRQKLTGNYSKVTIRGTYDMTGVSCTGATANAICQAVRNGSSGTWSCGGRTWRTGDCGGPVEVNANGNMCSCSAGYTVRPCIDYPGSPNPNWGGANTSTCNSPSQVLEFICE